LNSDLEKVVAQMIDTHYLCKQRYKESVPVREIAKHCKLAGLRAPVRNTIRKRIDELDPVQVVSSRYGAAKTRELLPVKGSTPTPHGPLETVQMDHTKVDLILVDESHRKLIGRPFLTLAIDVYTRCIVGNASESGSTISYFSRLCLAHAVTDKRAGLERLGITDFSWPMSGKPAHTYTDNAPEFKSEALIRGCDQHHIEITFRPLGQPHFPLSEAGPNRASTSTRVIPTSLYRLSKSSIIRIRTLLFWYFGS
jgi:putative transposase